MKKTFQEVGGPESGPRVETILKDVGTFPTLEEAQKAAKGKESNHVIIEQETGGPKDIERYHEFQNGKWVLEDEVEYPAGMLG